MVSHPTQRINADEMSAVYIRATKKNLIDRDDTAVIFYDLSRLERNIFDLIKAFPSNALHAVAIKANPTSKILNFLCDRGIGLEAASLPELVMAQKAGADSKKIVFDSPVKTNSELEYALKAGVHINADNFDELNRISALRESIETTSDIGIRINPQVGTGRITSTSVAGEYSKFGIPIKTRREELIKIFERYEWLRGVHLHVGSQGCGAELLLKGIQIVFDFIREVNERHDERRIDIFDIGGGLPVSYSEDETAVPMEEYARMIETSCASLMDGECRLITEFGRHVHANSAWVASRVEYVKEENNASTLMIHVGADLLLRKCLNQDDWHHDITLLDKDGVVKTGKKRKYVVAGPLCFAGDIIEKETSLPQASEGDLLLIHDVGAYTFSVWSKLVSRQTPKIIGYRDGGDRFVVLKPRESIDSVLSFWGE